MKLPTGATRGRNMIQNYEAWKKAGTRMLIKCAPAIKRRESRLRKMKIVRAWTAREADWNAMKLIYCAFNEGRIYRITFGADYGREEARMASYVLGSIVQYHWMSKNDKLTIRHEVAEDIRTAISDRKLGEHIDLAYMIRFPNGILIYSRNELGEKRRRIAEIFGGVFDAIAKTAMERVMSKTTTMAAPHPNNSGHINGEII